MSIHIMASRIADKLRNISHLQVFVTAEDIINKCESEAEVIWWYEKLIG